jgi:hypothetical protein
MNQSSKVVETLAAGVDGAVDAVTDHSGSRFPRSHTMKVLIEHPGVSILVVLAAGFLALRPGLAAKLFRQLPIKEISKALVGGFLTGVARRRANIDRE